METLPSCSSASSNVKTASCYSLRGVCRAPLGCLQLPLEQLSREAVAALGCAKLAVLITEDLRGQQACVRLRDVFGLRDTLLLLRWQEEAEAS